MSPASQPDLPFVQRLRRSLTIPVLGVGMLVSFSSSYYLLGVLAEPMSAALQLDSRLAFGALSAAFVVAALLTPLAGRWADMRGGREPLIVSAVVFALALAVLAGAHGPIQMMTGITLLGVGMGVGFHGPSNALLVAIHGHGARRPITAVSLFGAFGGAVGWPVTLWLMELWGWRGACVAWAVLNVGLCLPLFVLVLPAHARGGAAVQSDGKVRWDSRLIRLAILFACAWWVAAALASHLPRVMERLGLGPAEAALAASMMAIATIIMRLLSLVLPPVKSPVATVRLATLGHPAGVLAALLGGKMFAVCVAIGQGLGNGLLSIAAGVLPLHLWGPANYGLRQALMLMPARFVQAAAPVMFAGLLGGSVVLALAVTSTLCLVMFVMTIGLERRRLECGDELAVERSGK